MSMKNWAAREVEIACKREAPERKDGEWDYGCACYESALKAYNSLLDDEHSGMSWSITRNILVRLMNGLPLTPIEDVPEVWNLVYKDEDGTEQYQCKRMSSLFKYVYPDGTVRFHANNYYCVDDEKGLTYTGGGAADVLEEYVDPIALPYWPPEKKYEIHTMEYLTDRKNGDWDTKAYLYIICPDGKRIDVNRYFGETNDGWQEITEEEYNNRKILHLERELREQREAEARENH